jgi:hypothetical protein
MEDKALWNSSPKILVTCIEKNAMFSHLLALKTLERKGMKLNN